MAAGSASAQGLAGIKLTPTNVDTATLDVDVDLTVFYTTGIGFSTAWVGDTSGFGTIANAIEWGDGAVVPPIYPTGLPFSTTSTPTGAPGPVRAYRGAFSHTYPATGIYTATVASHNLLFTTAFPGVFTGQTATFQTPTYSVFGGTRMVLTNTTEIVLENATPTIEIDTVSDLGLLLLALTIGAAGLFLLKR
ncbi:MAG: hypothetical protein AAF657_12880 [Acidobacteriota bacterium]